LLIAGKNGNYLKHLTILIIHNFLPISLPPFLSLTQHAAVTSNTCESKATSDFVVCNNRNKCKHKFAASRIALHAEANIYVQVNYFSMQNAIKALLTSAGECSFRSSVEKNCNFNENFHEFMHLLAGFCVCVHSTEA